MVKNKQSEDKSVNIMTKVVKGPYERLFNLNGLALV